MNKLKANVLSWLRMLVLVAMLCPGIWHFYGRKRFGTAQSAQDWVDWMTEPLHRGGVK